MNLNVYCVRHTAPLHIRCKFRFNDINFDGSLLMRQANYYYVEFVNEENEGKFGKMNNNGRFFIVVSIFVKNGRNMI